MDTPYHHQGGPSWPTMTVCPASLLRRWAAMWLASPMRDPQMRPHSEQAKPVAVEVAVAAWCLLFRASRGRLFLPSSKCWSPRRERVCHSWRSSARASRFSGEMLQAFSIFLVVSLYRFSCPPAVLAPTDSSPYRSCLGSLSLSILITWPTHRSLLRYYYYYLLSFTTVHAHQCYLTVYLRFRHPVSFITVCGTSAEDQYYRDHIVVFKYNFSLLMCSLLLFFFFIYFMIISFKFLLYVLIM